MKKRYLLSVAMACLLGACSEVDTLDTNVMTFAVQHPNAMTRVTDTAFEQNDEVGLYVTEKDAPLQLSGNHANNERLTYTTQWTTSRPIYWDNGTYDIYAYYPYQQNPASVDNMPFSVALDQTGEGYAQSDFLWSSAKAVAASNTPVQLPFRHRMSRILIKLVKSNDYEGELPDVADVYIHNTVPDATIDLAAGLVTRDKYATVHSIKAKALGGHMYTAIIVPQRLSNRVPLVEVIMKGVSYLYEARFLFKAGMQHPVMLSISDNPDKMRIEIGGEVENWSDKTENLN